MGLSPGRSGRKISISRVSFLCRLLFQYPSRPCVIRVVHKKNPSHSAKSTGGRLKLNAQASYIWALHEVTQTRLLFRYPSRPCVTAVAHKRSWSFCRKCRWQVTAKHAYTLRMWLCTLCMWWCMVIWCTQNLRQDGSSFMWHQPCQHCKYTTLVDIQKRAIKNWSLM